MNVKHLAFILLAVPLIGFGQTVIDSSTEQKFKTSLENVVNTVPKDKLTVFKSALRDIAKSVYCPADYESNKGNFHTAVVLNHKLEQALHGKSWTDIIQLGTRIREEIAAEQQTKSQLALSDPDSIKIAERINLYYSEASKGGPLASLYLYWSSKRVALVRDRDNYWKDFRTKMPEKFPGQNKFYEEQQRTEAEDEQAARREFQSYLEHIKLKAVQRVGTLKAYADVGFGSGLTLRHTLIKEQEGWKFLTDAFGYPWYPPGSAGPECVSILF